MTDTKPHEKAPPVEPTESGQGGEDESSTSHDGKDGHLHEDQKPTTK